ncbi:MAG: hypothetical protein R3B47_02970 [Bacteroidia bacterium]
MAELLFDLDKAREINMELYEPSGRLIARDRTYLGAGKQRWLLPQTSALSGGLFVCKISSGNRQLFFRLFAP